MPTHHVAILLPRYIDLILRGRKTIESRLTLRPLPPFAAVGTGDVIHFKASGGPYRAVARAGRVWCFDGRTPAAVQRLRRRFDRRVCGDADYWHTKRDSRYATFIELRNVNATDQGPRLAPSRGPAWFVLDHAGHDIASQTPVATLTAAAIRNAYVRVPRPGRDGGSFPADAHARDSRPGRSIELLLPDGDIISTDIVRGMLRWRGWASLFRARDVAAGDQVCFEALGRRRYRVVLSRKRP
jgi:hypothetical protein